MRRNHEISDGRIGHQGSSARMPALVKGRLTKVAAGKSILGLAIHTAEKGKVWVTARIPGFFMLARINPKPDPRVRFIQR